MGTIAQNVDEWYWDFGDGHDTTYNNAATFVEHYYENVGSYTVTLAISVWTNGTLVSDTIKKQVDVMPSPVTNFVADPTCAGAAMHFIDST